MDLSRVQDEVPIGMDFLAFAWIMSFEDRSGILAEPQSPSVSQQLSQANVVV
jgi:hypothetical protein